MELIAKSYSMTNPQWSGLRESIKRVSQVMQDNTPERSGLSFYRAGMSLVNDNPYQLRIIILASDFNGNFKKFEPILDLRTRTLHYPSQMAQFRSENDVVDAVFGLVESFTSLNKGVSRLYFDFSSVEIAPDGLSRVFAISDPFSEGDMALFASSRKDFPYVYDFSDGAKRCKGTALCMDWYDCAAMKEYVAKFDA